MEKELNSCCVQGCQNTSSDGPLYSVVIDKKIFNSSFMDATGPDSASNLVDDNTTTNSQDFLCAPHLNLLESLQSPQRGVDVADENECDQYAVVPDRLSQQLSTLTVSQPQSQDPNDFDDAPITETSCSQSRNEDFDELEDDPMIADAPVDEKSFIELKSLYSQNLDSIFPPLPDDPRKTCRICGEITVAGIQIFSEDEDTEISLLEKIHNYLPIKLKKDDNLPKLVCQNCNKLLNVSHDLAMRSLATEAVLTDSVPEELMDEQKKLTDVKETIPMAPENHVTSTIADDGENEIGNCSQETVSDATLFSSQSLITSDDDDDLPVTRFDRLRQLRTYGKKRPASLDDRVDEFGGKKKRELPIFEKWFNCNLCVASTTDEDTMISHKDRHRLNRPVLFWCNYCAREFPKEWLFTDHVLGVHKEQSKALTQAYKCTSCHRVFSAKSTASIHFLLECAVHPITNYSTTKGIQEVYIRYAYVCEFCWKGFSYVSVLNQHRNQEHFNEVPWNGELCIEEEKNDRFVEIFGIKTAFACRSCAHIFISWENYVHHLKEHSDGLHICTTCGTKFGLYEEFKKHRESKHDYRVVFREMSQEAIAASIALEGSQDDKKQGPE